MEFPMLKFDHEDDSFVDSIGMTETQYELARYTVVYEITSPIVLENELDIEVDHGGTKSAILQRSLSHFKNDPEMTFMIILVFDTVHRDIKEQMQFLNKIGKEIRKKSKDGDLDDAISVMKIKGNSLEDAMEQIKMVIQAEKIMSVMSFLKDSKCDYDKFIDYTVNDKSRSEVLGIVDEDEKPKKSKKRKIDTSDIDDLIRRAFMNKDDDDDDDE
jgi:hypothetical protein